MVDLTNGDTDSGYAGFKIETRFRPVLTGTLPLDPILYAEFQQLYRGDANQTYELKLILARDFERVNVAFNVAVEEERTADATWNTELEYAAGTSYEISKAFKVGAEIFGKAEKNVMNEVENRLWAGPCVSWARGGSGAMRGIWVTLAAGGKLAGDEADTFYGRLIVGLQF
jgi:hypothetical protein